MLSEKEDILLIENGIIHSFILILTNAIYSFLYHTYKFNEWKSGLIKTGKLSDKVPGLLNKLKNLLDICPATGCYFEVC